MNKLNSIGLATALMWSISSSAFAAMSATDCQTLFQQADANKDGTLQPNEAKIFLDAMNKANVKPKNASIITQKEFTAACEQDAFANIKTNLNSAAATNAAPAVTNTGQKAQGSEQALAVPAQGVFASELRGATVYNRDNLSIGKITDLILATQNSQADEVVVGVGGFLGIGEKEVLMDRARLAFVATKGKIRIVVDTTKSELQSLPAFKRQ